MRTAVRVIVGEGAMADNTELLTETLSNQTRFVLLEHPIGIVLPRNDPLALDQIGIQHLLSIHPHLQLVERLQLSIHWLLPLRPIMTTQSL